MKSLEELKAFTQGYIIAMPEADTSEIDDWVVWGGYDINLVGNEWGGPTNLRSDELYVLAYPDGWQGSLPEPIHAFVVTGD
jgi:hypothetical protein